MFKEAPATRAAPSTQIRGILISTSLKWFDSVYGEAAQKRVLASLPEAERATFGRFWLSAGWYPMCSWERVVIAQRSEGERLGTPGHLYDRRAIREAGGILIRTLFHTILARMSPQTLIERAPMMYQKFFDNGAIEIAKNNSGHAILSLRMTPDMVLYTERYILPLVSYYIELNGGKSVSLSASRVGESSFVAEYTYQ